MCVASLLEPHITLIFLADAFVGHAVWGDDASGLLSAVGYGAYAVMIRTMCPRDERACLCNYFLDTLDFLMQPCYLQLQYVFC